MDYEQKIEDLAERVERLERENRELRKTNNIDEERPDQISRRSFLRKLGAGAIGLGALSLSPAASSLKLTKNGMTSSGLRDLSINNDGSVEIENGNLRLNNGQINLDPENPVISGQNISSDGSSDFYWRMQQDVALDIYDTNRAHSLLKVKQDGPVEIKNAYLKRQKIPAFRAKYSSGEGGKTLPYVQDFETVLFDNNGDYDGTDTFTAPVAGIYQLRANLREEQFYGEIAVMKIRFLVNGTERAVTRQDLNGSEPHGHLSSLLELSAGDQVQVEWDSSNTSSASLETDEAWFEGYMITSL